MFSVSVSCNATVLKCFGLLVFGPSVFHFGASVLQCFGVLVRSFNVSVLWCFDLLVL